MSGKPAPVSRGRAWAAGLLFWTMFLVGGGALAACLLVPAWLEYYATSLDAAAAHERNEQLKQLVEAQRLQIAHHQRDPQYNERFIREEFRIPTPGVQIVTVDAEPTAVIPPPTPDSPKPITPWTAPLEYIEPASRSPVLAIFVLDQSRPAVMALSGALLVCSLFLIPGPRSLPRA